MSARRILIETFVFMIFLASHIFTQITVKKLNASDGEAGEYFGGAVAIYDDYAICGASFDDDNGINSGSAYVFKWDGGTWLEEAKLLPGDGGILQYFGSSVAIYGDFCIIGVDREDSNTGSAYIFKRDGNNWLEEAKLTASDGATNDFFGSSVAIYGDYAVIGAPFDDDNGINSGSAYVFKRDGTDWLEDAKLTASDGVANDFFGSSAIYDSYVIVGASGDDDHGARSGSAYIFKRDDNNWVEEAKLTASDGAADNEFGGSVALHGDFAICGASGDDDHGATTGSAYIFKRDGSNWLEDAKLTASDGAASDYFGNSVAIYSNRAVVAARLDDNGTNYGSVYAFRRVSNNWLEEAKLIASDVEESNGFGVSVAMHGDRFIVGANFDNGNGDASGAAYVYSGFGSFVLELHVDPQFEFIPLEGDTFPYNLTIVNNTDSSRFIDVWTTVVRPEEPPSDPLYGPEHIFMNPSDTIAIDSILLPVSGDIETGEFWLVAYAGSYPSDTLVIDSLSFTKFGHPPFVSSTLADLELIEDYQSFDIANLDTVFSDDDSDILTYQVEISEDFALLMLNESFLQIAPVANAFGELEVIVSASDEQLVTISDTFTVNILPVNDPSLPFDLLAPLDGEVLSRDVEEIAFVWDSADDVDNEVLVYTLWLGGEDLDTLFFANEDTSYIFNDLGLLNSNGVYTWSVEVTDGEFFASSIDSFVFTAPLILSLPLVDNFSNEGKPDPQLWSNFHATVNDLADDAPSPPLALNLNGSPNNGDIIELWPVDLRGFEDQGVILTYYFQPQGTIDRPEPADSLCLYFRNDLGEWILIRSYPGTDLQPFQQEVIDISAAPSSNGSYFYHSFQLRFRSLGAAGSLPNDNWFIDDVRLEMEIDPTDITPSTQLPTSYRLHHNYPNPFNPVTTIRYSLPKVSDVRLTVYDLLGREVRTLVNRHVEAGYHQIDWNGRDNSGTIMASGIYLYRLTAGEFVQVRKMLLTK